MLKHTLLFSLLSAQLGVVVSQDTSLSIFPCPFLGPAFPAPSNVASAPAVTAALQNITGEINLGLNTGYVTNGEALDNVTSAFSITAFSTADLNSLPFWEFHWSPPALSQVPAGVTNVTGDTVYRIGSLSKVFTVFTWLVTDGFKRFQDTITQHLSGLNSNRTVDPVARAAWDEITISALASHLSGIGVECKLPTDNLHPLLTLNRWHSRHH